MEPYVEFRFGVVFFPFVLFRHFFFFSLSLVRERHCNVLGAHKEYGLKSKFVTSSDIVNDETEQFIETK